MTGGWGRDGVVGEGGGEGREGGKRVEGEGLQLLGSDTPCWSS